MLCDMTGITLRGLTKAYGATTAVAGIDLDIAPGELFFLIGPSGCGKSTVLRMIAGLITPTAGRVLLGTRDVTNVPARERNTAMVFQGYALWPHMTVAENVAFGLDVRNVGKEERAVRVKKALESVRLPHLADRRPGQLSGGEQQRVALARALVVNPDVLLLDEPLSNLDANLRLDLRREVKRVCTETGITAVYVTHDQAEALSMAHRVAVLKLGQVCQIGSPREIYDQPNSRFVAAFVGQSNFIPAVIRDVTTTSILLDSKAGSITAKLNGKNLQPGTKVTCSVRPESVRVLDDHSSLENTIAGRTLDAVYLGHATECVVEVAPDVILTTLGLRIQAIPRVGEALRVGFDARDVVVLPAE